jgi:hypothetical protein
MLNSLAQAKLVNRDAGQHFFDADAMRFFASRMPKTVMPVPNGALFVTSEQYRPFDGAPDARLFTIRFIHDSGVVETVGAFQGWSTREGANRAARRMAAVWTADAFFGQYTRQNGGTFPVVVLAEHRGEDGRLNGVIRFFDAGDKDVRVLDGGARRLDRCHRFDPVG